MRLQLTHRQRKKFLLPKRKKIIASFKGRLLFLKIKIMKLIVKKEIKEEIEITLPVYIKHGCAYYRIESKNKALEVSRDGKNHGIRQINPLCILDLLLIDGRMITEGEYNEELTLAFSHISLAVLKQTSEIPEINTEVLDEKFKRELQEQY